MENFSWIISLVVLSLILNHWRLRVKRSHMQRYTPGRIELLMTEEQFQSLTTDHRRMVLKSSILHKFWLLSLVSASILTGHGIYLLVTK